MALSADTSRGVAACGLSALAFFFGTGLNPHWGLLWVAPVPVLIAAYDGGRSRAAALGFVAWFAGGLNLWSFLRDTLGVPLPIVLVMMAMPAIAFSLALLLSRALLLRGRPILALLAVPALWVSFEYLLSLASPHGTYGSIAYTQIDLLPVLQIASVAGLSGISFVLLLVAACIAIAFHRRASPRPAVRLVTSVAVVVVAVLTWGGFQLRQPPGDNRIEVALLATDGATGSRLPSGDEGLRLVEEYARRIASRAPDGVRLLVLPEKIAQLDRARMTRAAEALAAAAIRARLTLVAGLEQRDPGQSRVLAVVFGADGRALGTYAKHHLLPPFESESAPGHETLVLEGQPEWGVQICKDMDFQALSRRYAQSGVGLMAVPAWDFGKDGRLHSRMAVLRGVEGGFVVVRAARNGLLTVSDERGRIVAESRSGPQFAFLTATVRPPRGGTFYSRFGDWFAWICLLMVAVCLGATRMATRLP